MNLRLDQVAFGWSDHEGIVDAFREVGLDIEYGGEHADGTTQMSLLGFEDGTHLELIAPVGEEAPRRWPAFLRTDGGPCAYLLGAGGDPGEAYSLREPRPWFDRELAWLDDDRLAERVGVVR